MSQKSRKGLSTLHKHMSAETKLQVDQDTITERLIFPVLSTANPNPTTEETYYDSTQNHFTFILMDG